MDCWRWLERSIIRSGDAFSTTICLGICVSNSDGYNVLSWFRDTYLLETSNLALDEYPNLTLDTYQNVALDIYLNKRAPRLFGNTNIR